MQYNRSSRPELLSRVAKERRSGGKKLAFPAKPLPHSILLTFKKYDYSNLYSKVNPNNTTKTITSSQSSNDAQLKYQSVIELPFPTTLSDLTSLQLVNFGRSALAEIGANALAGVNQDGVNSSLLQKLKNGVMGAASGIQNAGAGLVSKNPEGRQDVAAFLSYMTSVFGRNDYGSTIEGVVGRTVNPKETLAFAGVDLKKHSFTWRLFPSNSTDSEIIRQIAAEIKKNILPTTRNFSGIEKMFLAYPSTVDIELLGVDNSHFFKFKRCMVAGFNVGYDTGDGIPLLKGGKPAAVTFTLELAEVEAHDAGIYESIYNEKPLEGNIDIEGGQ